MAALTPAMTIVPCTTALRQSLTSPRTVAGMTNVVQVATGTLHTCAVVADGSAYCWGKNLNGALGTGDQYSRFLPTRVAF